MAGRVAGRPFDAQPAAAQLDRLRPVELDVGLTGADEVTHRPRRVLEDGGLRFGNPVMAQVAADLGQQLVELEITGMHHRDLEPVHVEVEPELLLERSRGPEMVRVDVGDHQPPEPGVGPAHVFDGRKQRRDRVVGLDPTVEEVDLGAVGEEKAIDDLLLPGDREPDLVDARGHLVQLRAGSFGGAHVA